MRIGIITNKFAPSGGMERYAQDVVRELLRQGARDHGFHQES